MIPKHLAPARRSGPLFAAIGLSAAIFLPGAAPALAAGRPVVVELFTSQGCSSCPPAEAYLGELARRGDVLPLGFHVTYWNALGWRDPFSFDGATLRQESYAARLGGGSYTPEMVVDGRHHAVGSDRGAVEAAIRGARGDEAVPLSLVRKGGDLAIAVGAGQGKGRVLLVGFDRQHRTPVGRGENSGRTLTESNVVRSLRVVTTYDGAPLALTLPAGAGEEAAVIVQGADGRILGAARS